MLFPWNLPSYKLWHRCVFTFPESLCQAYMCSAYESLSLSNQHSIQRKVHGRLNASWKISSLAVNGHSFLVIDGYLLNPCPVNNQETIDPKYHYFPILFSLHWRWQHKDLERRATAQEREEEMLKRRKSVQRSGIQPLEVKKRKKCWIPPLRLFPVRISLSSVVMWSSLYFSPPSDGPDSTERTWKGRR